MPKFVARHRFFRLFVASELELGCKINLLENSGAARQWWHMPLIPSLGGRGGQVSEFGARLVYRKSSRTSKAAQRNLVLKQ